MQAIPDMVDQRFPKERRLRRQADFDRVFASRAYAADDVLVVSGVLNDRLDTRLGIGVSRKVGNAVVRNRWKRLIREAFRTLRARLPTGCDLVVRPRRGAQPDGAAIAQSLPRLARRVHARLKKNC